MGFRMPSMIANQMARLADVADDGADHFPGDFVYLSEVLYDFRITASGMWEGSYPRTAGSDAS
jgi:hypothetical protein